MSAFVVRSALSHDEPGAEANEDEVADYIEDMLNELSLLAADRVTSPAAQKRISDKIVLFEIYFARKRPRMLC